MNTPAIHYVDLPDISETFVDSVQSIFFDGQTARLELCVTRMDEPTPPQPQTGRKYTACRLVMPPAALLELHTHMQNIINALIQQGVLKPVQPESGTIH